MLYLDLQIQSELCALANKFPPVANTLVVAVVGYNTHLERVTNISGPPQYGSGLLKMRKEWHTKPYVF
jgi:hypothetical protein